MSPFARVHTISYRHSVGTVTVSRIVSEIFNVKKCLDLEIWVTGHSSLNVIKVVPFDRLGMVSY